MPDVLYRASTTPQLIDVPERTFAMVDGHGDPNASAAYAEAIQVLYTVSYSARFAVRRATGVAYRVAPLEGLWWAADLDAFTAGDKTAWDWTMMIAQPDDVTAEVFDAAVAKAAEKVGADAAARVRLERFAEGRCAQVLHVGPYAAEGPTIAALHAFIAQEGLRLRGKHHEIYLGDPRRAAPEKLKTIIRQPVA
jgi:hypothetical protein